MTGEIIVSGLMSPGDTKKKLLVIPEQIYLKEKDNLKQQQAMQKLTQTKRSIEEKITLEVFNEVDGEKKKYPNEKLRKAEIDNRLNKDEDYNHAQNELNSMKKITSENQLDIEFHKRYFRSLEAVTRIETN